jgi:fatty acid desaturase
LVRVPRVDRLLVLPEQGGGVMKQEDSVKAAIFFCLALVMFGLVVLAAVWGIWAGVVGVGVWLFTMSSSGNMARLRRLREGKDD